MSFYIFTRGGGGGSNPKIQRLTRMEAPDSVQENLLRNQMISAKNFASMYFGANRAAHLFGSITGDFRQNSYTLKMASKCT